MYCILRNLCNRTCQQNLRALNQKRFVKILPTTQGVNYDETFEEKNARLKRPLSPHLSIYKPQITSILSISHRISGVVLFGYFAGIAGIGFLGAGDDVVLFLRSLELSPATWVAIKTVIATPFTFHFGNGIRHLVWDAGIALTNKGVNITGYGVSALTIVFALMLAFL